MYTYIIESKEKEENLFVLSSPVMRNSKKRRKSSKRKTHLHTHTRTFLLLETDTVTRAKQNFLFFDYFHVVWWEENRMIINSMECKQIGDKQKQK